ncbi:hypothetical protein OG21DRAFT_1516388 [Imleria badia]|nr:hypothetical protein OG21DRAFT_1516388 [Imleria badia]
MFASTRELHYTVDFPYFDTSFVVAFAASPAAVLHLASFRVERGFLQRQSTAQYRHCSDTGEPVFDFRNIER